MCRLQSGKKKKKARHSFGQHTPKYSCVMLRVEDWPASQRLKEEGGVRKNASNSILRSLPRVGGLGFKLAFGGEASDHF